mmetsp:Transcript_28730/g.67374  ORF Transcript_28730/g.67374 Transcript_28730/m.67374 type:complete len:127 (+) Transcript_28730:909-1289(+)
MEPYPSPNLILVLDNCQIHHAREAELLAVMAKVTRPWRTDVGALLIFLAPYCCIDNSDEYGFSVFKACWRRNGDKLKGMRLDRALEWCFYNCYAESRVGPNAPSGPAATYRHCGYCAGGQHQGPVY